MQFEVENLVNLSICSESLLELYFKADVCSIMLPFKILINNNNGGLAACPQLKCKFIMIKPSPQNPLLLDLLSNLCTSCQQSRIKKYD